MAAGAFESLSSPLPFGELGSGLSETGSIDPGVEGKNHTRLRGSNDVNCRGRVLAKGFG